MPDHRRRRRVDAGHRLRSELSRPLDPPIVGDGDPGRSDAVPVIGQRQHRAAVRAPRKSPSVQKYERLAVTGNPHVEWARAMTQSIPLDVRGHGYGPTNMVYATERAHSGAL